VTVDCDRETQSLQAVRSKPRKKFLASKAVRRLLFKLTRLLNRKKFLLAFGLLLLILSCSYLKQQGIIAPERIFAFLDAYPTLAPLFFIGLYIVLSVAIVPTLPLNLGAGFLWGTAWGSVFSIAGATAGAICAFLVSRYFAGDYFNRHFKHRAWLWLRAEIESKGWQAIAFTRINPVFSFGPLNYFFGITSIDFKTYIWATALFIAPPSILFAAVGHSMGDFTLTGSAANLMRNTIVISAIVTALTIARLVMKRRMGSSFSQRV